MGKIVSLLFFALLLFGCSTINDEGRTIEQAFRNPPDSARPWVFWIWSNGNISKEGITADLEAMKRVGIGGALWYETGGPWWAPAGDIAPYSPQWYDNMQWAIQEADRLDLEIGMNLGYGYGAGGPHISPDISMQKLYWSQTIIKGGEKIDTILRKPEISTANVLDTWLKRAGHQDDIVVENLKKLEAYQEAENTLEKMKQIDHYLDIAVLAVPNDSEDSLNIPMLNLRSGLSGNTYFFELDQLSGPAEAIIPKSKIIELTNQMNSDGTISWHAPPGEWRIIRIGQASNFRLARPVPTGAVGLECNKLSQEGINTHFKTFLKPIFEKAGNKSGKTFKFVHIASWEDGPQNWTKEFPEEFLNRRGYNINPWLPALTGSIVESPELTERFFWDFRLTVSELILENYHQKLKELASVYNIQSSREAYGNLCIDNLKYAETNDLPVGEFWQSGQGYFPDFVSYHNTLKVAASSAHVNNLPRAGAEAFTYTGKFRSWKEHPFLLKGIGDGAFCEGINHFFLHLYAHQAYEEMKPGLTHRHAGGHFHRHNTWWEYSKPWIEYITRCQYMLQQGRFMADVIYFFGEGAPLHVQDTKLDLPKGYNYDVCSDNILYQMEVDDGKIILPSGMTYNYLLLPNTDKLTLTAVQKINELADSGAKIIAQKRFVGIPGLSDFPEADKKVKVIGSQLWSHKQIITESDWEKIFQNDKIQPDFTGEGLNYIHRKMDEPDIDIYFVANPEPNSVENICSFRISEKIPELWNPKTGEIRELPEYEMSQGHISIPLRFEPMQSWFVVFRKTKSTESSNSKNFPEYHAIIDIDGPWQISFDSKWGGPAKPVTFDSLRDWSKHADLGIRYYSGTAVYEKTFNFSATQLESGTPIFLDLGKVEVIAQVTLNDKDCGITWKPPYRVDISHAVKPGQNKLEIDVVNLWANRLIGDEQLPEDCDWIDWQVLKEWPEWFLNDDVPRPTERYTFTSVKVFDKDDPLYPSGLMGPVQILKITF